MAQRARGRRQERRARRAAATVQRVQAQRAQRNVVNAARVSPSLISPIVLACAGVFAFHNSLNGPFIFDDRLAIRANPTIRHLWPIWDALSPPGQGSAVGGRPVVNLSLAVNYALGGLNVWGYHAVNLSLHILAGLALFGIVRRTLSGPRLASSYGADATWLATAVAILWLVHPLQTESVTYVVQRTELMMGLFLLLTLYAVVRGSDSPNPWRWYAAATISSVLGMGSKEVMVVAPVIVLLYDRVFLAGSFRAALRERRGLYVGLAASWLVLVALVSAHPRSGSLVSTGPGAVTPLVYVQTQFGVIAHYLRLSLWPHPLVVDYEDWPIARSPADFLPWAAMLGALAGAALIVSRRRPWVGFLAAWFFLILAPTSTIVPIVTEVAAERRTYLPLAAVVVLVVLGMHAGLRAVTRRVGWQTHRMVPIVILTALAVALASATVRRNEDYASTLAVWKDVVAKRPNSARARLNLGDTFYRQGQMQEAKDQFAEAVRIAPANDVAHYGLGLVLAGQRDFDGAIAHYTEALRLRPRYADAHNSLGVVYAMQGRTQDAIAEYSQAVQINPNQVNAHYNLGLALGSQGKLDEAARQYAEALRIEPEYADAHYQLGRTLTMGGKLEDARRHLEAAVRLAPTFQPARSALDDLQRRDARPGAALPGPGTPPGE